jgi:type II secretory pathway component PulM
LITISHEQEYSRRKRSELGITFGKVKKMESHRYTEMEERQPREKEKKRKPLVEISNLCKVGKYDSIFKPAQMRTENEEARFAKERALPPINSRRFDE